MRRSYFRGMTLADVIVSAALLAIAVALILPVLRCSGSAAQESDSPSDLAAVREAARRTACQNQLKQIGMACILYENEPGNGTFPSRSTDRFDPYSVALGDPQEALSLLYPGYVPDSKVFSCPSAPLPPDMLRKVFPTDAGRYRAGGFSHNTKTSYGYSQGHRQADAKVIVAADYGHPPAAKNSDNHDGSGQNVLDSNGHVEFRTTVENKIGIDAADGVTRLVDDNIYAPAPAGINGHRDLDSDCE
jgi:hypothetical protein